MNGFMEQCVDRDLELANIPRAKSKAASTPSLEERNTADNEFQDPGKVSSIEARTVRFDGKGHATRSCSERYAT